MNSSLWLWVGVGGSIGSLCRYGVARWAGNRFRGLFPWGTLLVNLIGACLLGMLQGSTTTPLWAVFLGTGVLGGLTTFSTWMLESIRLTEEGEYTMAAMNLLGSAALGLLAFWLGYWLTGGHL